MKARTGDYYGGHADEYLKYRPGYPEKLFQQLLSKTPHKLLAWDCGTGNGQVATRLAEDFSSVLATDLSQLQLDKAISHPLVDYQCREAQNSGLENSTVSLVTVASAVHWFDQKSFYAEVKRVLSPGGVLAVWTYAPDLVSPSGIAEIVRNLAQSTLGEDWPEGLSWVNNKYQDLPFPFPEFRLEPVDFVINWSLNDLLGWIGTWSAVRRYRARTGRDPMLGLRELLLDAWPGTQGAASELQLPLYYRAGQS